MLGFVIDEISPEDIDHENLEARKLSIQRCIQSLAHACRCYDSRCQVNSCLKMKTVVLHTKRCKRKTERNCPICNQLIALCCYHAKYCQEINCSVPFCGSVKEKLRQTRTREQILLALENVGISREQARARLRPRLRARRASPAPEDAEDAAPSAA